LINGKKGRCSGPPFEELGGGGRYKRPKKGRKSKSKKDSGQKKKSWKPVASGRQKKRKMGKFI